MIYAVNSISELVSFDSAMFGSVVAPPLWPATGELYALRIIESATTLGHVLIRGSVIGGTVADIVNDLDSRAIYAKLAGHRTSGLFS
jgi:urea transporter